MSREVRPTLPVKIEGSPEPSSDDIHLQIDLRLRRDDLDVEVEELRHVRRNAPTHAELCRLACRIYDARRAREKMLERRLFGEPAWDMMLALYCLPKRGERLGISALCNASAVPQTTALRVQQILIGESLIERVQDEVDKRRTWVRLTERGRNLLEDYLLWLFDFEQRGGRPLKGL